MSNERKKLLLNWKLNKNINPRTNRIISENGKIYKKLDKEYNEIFDFDINNLKHHIDIISQEKFIEKINNKLIWVYNDIDKVVFYKSNNNLDAFTIDSLKFMKKNNFLVNPIDGKKIPEKLFENLKLDENNEIDFDDLDLKNINFDDDMVRNHINKFFQKLSSHSIFIDGDLFNNLNDEKINKFGYEMKEFYYNNLSEDIRKEIDKKDGKLLFKDNFSEISKKKIYLINCMNLILKNIKNEFKIFAYYIIVGALSIVIEKVKNDYPNYAFNF